jgi:hypothetical protein
MTTIRVSEDQTPGAFAPDAIMRSQFFGERGSPVRLSGEHRLALAILEDAIDIYCKREALMRGNRRIYRETARWIHSTDRSWCFSFERICEVLGFDSEYIRRGLLARRGYLARSLDLQALDDAFLRHASGE